ncbi:hypothetical protein SAMN05444157_2808 [Frankineae bacterium MT45]|nr:hypothetical protein SAMN05444157_2808 [Frankineae bacterium MT45]
MATVVTLAASGSVIGSASAATAAIPPPQPPTSISHCTATPCTPASTRSSTSQLFNNWDDLVGVAQSATLFPKDNTIFGPSLAELRYKGDWNENQVQSEAAYTAGLGTGPDLYPPSWNSNLAFDSGGVLHQNYLDQRGVTEPVRINKSYISVPGQEFFIVTYDLTNLTAQGRTFNFMDNVELNNTQFSAGGQPAPSVGVQTAVWNAAHRGYDADMTGSGQFYFASGAYQPMASHQAGGYIAGPPTPGDPFQSTVRSFQAKGTLSNNSTYTGQIVSLGVQRHVTLAANATTSLSFAYTVQGSQAAASSAIGAALSKSATVWAASERNVYKNWLALGKHATQNDQGVNSAFAITLVTLKQSQQPQFGSWVAATSPAYDYKVWPRDASVTAMSMDAAGHTAEAAKYYHWMASVQNTTSPPNSGLSPGTWFTNYSFWNANQPIAFVQPELDSTGLFIDGVWKHYQQLAASNPVTAKAFLASPDISAAVKRGANFIRSGIDPTLGFGPQDFSIWEERFEFATFTQVTYTTGLTAAAKIATVLGNPAEATAWSAGAATIRAAILRPTNTPGKPGLWYTPGAAGNPPIGCLTSGTFHGPNCNAPYPSTGDKAPYFARGIFDKGGETPNNIPPISVDSEVDSSTGLLWVLGVISPTDARAVAQRDKILKWLGKGTYGISRHENDDFYYSSIYSPGGQYESNVPNPVWPQPVMYMTMLNTWQGNAALAAARLRYYASVTPVGYEPPGEAVDWSNNLPLISTASEPVTGAWFMLATLVAQGQFNPRI